MYFWQDDIVFSVPIKQKHTPPVCVFSDFADWVVDYTLREENFAVLGTQWLQIIQYETKELSHFKIFKFKITML